MIHLKVQQIGDQVALVLDEDAQRALGVAPGDTLSFERTDAGVTISSDEAIERGKAFVQRYLGAFEALAR